MASKHQTLPREKTLEQIVLEVGLYQREAYEFIQHGLAFTAQQVHGQTQSEKKARHVSGQQLCEGLRDFALAQWGLLARAVLRKWGITSTLDFGRIVFALIDAQQMQKTEDDTIEDFRNVFDFRTSFDSGYRITVETLIS
jgi:uncharacterized repeat protein (TIGR04138 family)